MDLSGAIYCSINNLGTPFLSATQGDSSPSSYFKESINLLWSGLDLIYTYSMFESTSILFYQNQF